MARRCVITGKAVMSGNNVSHANNRTRRRFLPNIQDISVYSESLEKSFKFKMTTSGQREIDHNGGFDKWILSKAPTKVDPSLKRIRTQIEKAVEAAKAA